MYIVTTMSYDKLGALIRDRKVSLDNADLLFGYNTDAINKYFKDKIGYDGYVVGIRGRLNPYTAEMLESLDNTVRRGDYVLLEAEIDADDALCYSADGVTKAAEALFYGLPEDDVCGQLDSAEKPVDAVDAVEFLCVPYIKSNGKLVVTSLTEELSFDLEGIKFVKF